ncbi:MAG: ATP-binding protein [Oscillospiraceae bacterium]|nr:ATP-binding protein [Lachnospiraceae bacterium]MBQ5521458.1 ATP-binding protein [Oscillospiraceae bacterium]
MKELSLNILDIAMNSVKAGATLIEIEIEERYGWRTLTIRDNGCGMSPEFVKAVTDPFTTTRTTRKVGMGVPLLKLAAEQAGGTLNITSSQGEDHGTTVRATFLIDHLDCVPVGDYASTMVTLIQGSPDIDFVFQYRRESDEINLSTAEMRQVLGDVPLDTPEVLAWVAESLRSPEET